MTEEQGLTLMALAGRLCKLYEAGADEKLKDRMTLAMAIYIDTIVHPDRSEKNNAWAKRLTESHGRITPEERARAEQMAQAGMGGL